MTEFFVFSIACMCLTGAFLLSVMAFIFINGDIKKGEQKKITVTLYDGIYNEEVFSLDDISTICAQDGLPNGDHKIAVHLKNRDCHFGTSVKFE